MMEEDFRILAEYKEAQALKSKCHHQDHVERDGVYEYNDCGSILQEKPKRECLHPDQVLSEG